MIWVWAELMLVVALLNLWAFGTVSVSDLLVPSIAFFLSYFLSLTGRS